MSTTSRTAPIWHKMEQVTPKSTIQLKAGLVGVELAMQVVNMCAPQLTNGCLLTGPATGLVALIYYSRLQIPSFHHHTFDNTFYCYSLPFSKGFPAIIACFGHVRTWGLSEGLLARYGAHIRAKEQDCLAPTHNMCEIGKGSIKNSALHAASVGVRVCWIGWSDGAFSHSLGTRPIFPANKGQWSLSPPFLARPLRRAPFSEHCSFGLSTTHFTSPANASKQEPAKHRRRPVCQV